MESELAAIAARAAGKKAAPAKASPPGSASPASASAAPTDASVPEVDLSGLAGIVTRAGLAAEAAGADIDVTVAKRFDVDQSDDTSLAGIAQRASGADLGAVAVKLTRSQIAVAELDEAVRGGAAVAELKAKSLRDIQQETAYTWTWRAWARFKQAKAATTVDERIKWLLEAEECAHEGREHAALVGGLSVFQDIERILANAQK